VVCDFWVPGLWDMMWSLEVWQCMSHHVLFMFLILFTMLIELELIWIFACWYLWMLSLLVIFPGIFECIFYLFENFPSVWPIVNLLWVMISYDLWNSWCLLDELEILHVITRHLKLCHGVDPIHLSYVITDLWFFEVDTCLVDFFEHA